MKRKRKNVTHSVTPPLKLTYHFVCTQKQRKEKFHMKLFPFFLDINNGRYVCRRPIESRKII